MLAATAGDEEGGDVDGDVEARYVDGEGEPRPPVPSAALIFPPSEAGVDVDDDALFRFEPPPLLTGAAIGSRRSIWRFLLIWPWHLNALNSSLFEEGCNAVPAAVNRLPFHLEPFMSQPIPD